MVWGGCGNSWWLRIGANEVAKAAPGYPLLILSWDCLLPWGNYDATESPCSSHHGSSQIPTFFLRFRFSGGYVQSTDKQVGNTARGVRKGFLFFSASLSCHFEARRSFSPLPAILLRRRRASCFFGAYLVPS